MRILMLLMSFVAMICLSSDAWASVRVKGYYKKNGTYVAPHYRSSPNNSFGDNWSTKGNVNPYTGKMGTKGSPGSGTDDSSTESQPLNYSNSLSPAIVPDVNTLVYPGPNSLLYNIQDDTDDKWRFGVGVSYNMAGSIDGNYYVKSNSSTTTGKSFGSFKVAPKLSGHFRYLPKKSVGFMGGLDAIIDQTDKETGKTAISTYTLKANIAYRADQLYIYGGPSYSIYDLKIDMSGLPSGVKYDYGADTGFGGSIGIGAFISNNVSIDFDYQVSYISMHQRLKVGTTPSVDTYLDGAMQQVSVGIKAWF